MFRCLCESIIQIVWLHYNWFWIFFFSLVHFISFHYCQKIWWWLILCFIHSFSVFFFYVSKQQQEQIGLFSPRISSNRIKSIGYCIYCILFTKLISVVSQSVGRCACQLALWPLCNINGMDFFFILFYLELVNEIFFDDDDDFILFCSKKKSCDNHDHDDIDTRSSLNVMNDMII